MRFVVGFTGTQHGMTKRQKESVRSYFNGVLEHTKKHFPGSEIVAIHGDCVGADKDFDDIAKSLGIVRYIYPSNIEGKRAHTEKNGAIEAHLPVDPLYRNKLIVEASSAMLAAPKLKTPELRSGTWATIRFAEKIKKLLLIIDP